MKSHNNSRCSECSNICSEEDIHMIDGKPVCSKCLFGDTPPVRIYPIGVIVNTQERDESDFSRRGSGRTSRIELFPSQKRFIYRLEEESRLTIVYYLHKARAVRSRFKRGLDGKEVGVFASRTPDRLNKIGIQDVRLIQVQGTALIVESLDAINGTPVLDIKLQWHKA